MVVNNMKDPKKLQAGKCLKVLKGPFNAVVYKSAFTLELWQGSPGEKGSLYVMSFPVPASNKDDSTPTGVWAVASKLRKIRPTTARAARRRRGRRSEKSARQILDRPARHRRQSSRQNELRHPQHHLTQTPSAWQTSMGCIRLRDADITRVFESLVEWKSIVVVKD